MKPLLIFDYDGTVHETLAVYEPALRTLFNRLVNEGVLQNRELPQSEIASYLGMNIKDMWKSFAPELSEKVAMGYSAELTKIIFELVKKGKSRWYPSIEEFLTELKSQGYSMVILSNSKKINGEIYFKVFDMTRFFDKWYDCESFNWAPKTEIIKTILESYSRSGEDAIVIGDRDSDLQAAQSANAKFIGCSYGYGSPSELADADYYIQKPDKEEFRAAIRWINNQGHNP